VLQLEKPTSNFLHIVIYVDVSEKKENQGIIEAAQQHYGRIDALVTATTTTLFVSSLLF